MYGIPQDPTSLDPAETSDLIRDQIAFDIFETLLCYDWDSERYLPCLAVSWGKNDDGLVWTFHLRPNVKFHDGSALDALAVKNSFDRQIDSSCPYYYQNITEPYGKFVLKNMIQKINIIDGLTIQFKLKFPCSFFLDNISSPYLASIISTAALKKYGNQFGFHPCGTGPFKFRQWTPGEKIVLEKFKNYWGRPSRIERIFYKVVPNLKERIESLNKQELDIITGLSAASMNKLYYTPNIKIFTTTSLGTVFLGFNCQRKPYDNPKLRRAISNALDIKTMIASLSRGFAIDAQGPLPPSVPTYDPFIKQEGYNIEKAQKLIKQFGYSDSLIAKFCYVIETDTLRASPLVQYIKDQLEKIGIYTEIVPYHDWSLYLKEVLIQGKCDIFLAGWGILTKNADNFFYALFHSQSNWNLFHYSNPIVDQLLEQVRQTTTDWERKKLYREVQQIIINETPAIFLSHSKMPYAVGKRVKNFKTDLTITVRLNDVELRNN